MINMLFCPSVEVGTVEPKFLPDTPYKIVKNDKTTSKVPWISGITADEGALYTAEGKCSVLTVSMNCKQCKRSNSLSI